MPEVLDALADFCDRRLGKGVVRAKDTPNFIANRIGTFSMLTSLRLMSQLGMTVEEVDACTGPAIGWPKSATFRTAGYRRPGCARARHTEYLRKRARRRIPRACTACRPCCKNMMRSGWLGEKTGQRLLQAREKRRGRAKSSRSTSARWSTGRGKKRDSLPSKPAAPSKTRANACAPCSRPCWRTKAGDKAQQFLWGVYLPNVPLRCAPRPGNLRLHSRCGSRHALGLRLGTRPVRNVGCSRRGSDGRAPYRRGTGASAARNRRCWPRAANLSTSHRAAKFPPSTSRANTFTPLAEPAGIIILKSLKDRSMECRAIPAPA